MMEQPRCVHPEVHTQVGSYHIYILEMAMATWIMTDQNMTHESKRPLEPGLIVPFPFD